MNKKIFNAIIISIISVFVITIGVTIAVLSSDYNIGAKAAETKFQKLFTDTENAISRHGDADADFMKDFEKAIGSKDYYYSISLKSGEDNLYQFQNTSNMFTITKSSRITEGNRLDVSLTVMIYALPASLIYSRLRITFIVTVIATLASILCLVYLYTHRKSVYVSDAASNIKTDSILDDESLTLTDEDTSDDNSDNFEIPEVDDDISFDIPESSEIEENNTDDSEYSFYSETKQDDLISENITENTITLDNTTVEEKSEEDTTTNNTEPAENITEDSSEAVDLSVSASNNADTETVDSTNTNNTDLLFNTKTGFCSQSFLVNRLESELSRASSSELDLSLVLVRIPDIDFESSCGISLCNKILDIFHYRDILFEYNKDGVAIICNGTDIDKALEVSETIHTELCSILNTENYDIKPLIGIASRTLRFISGERLIVEAEQALLHAKDDPESPIIAFRVNPEKYRKFMATQK